MRKKHDITILNDQSHCRINIRHFKRFLASMIKKVAPEADEVSLLLTDDSHMKKWNRTFRGMRRSTDVLSFPDGQRNLEGKINLGDIIISVQRAQAQAQEEGCSVQEEIERLIIHGFLHLMGYDHTDREMEKWEEKLQPERVKRP